MKQLKLDLSLVESYLQSDEIPSFSEKVLATHQYMIDMATSKKQLLGWHDYPLNDHQDLLSRMSELATEVKLQANLCIVIGIGGSFLGARAVQEALTPYFGVHENGVEVVYAGQNMSGPYLKQLLRFMDTREVYVNVISKSGTTMEPALAFRVMEEYMIARYGEESRQRIIVTTDATKGALRETAKKKGYRTFSIEETIGGRYSVLTAVGLFPLAVAGMDVSAILNGARQATIELQSPDLDYNDAYRYAVIRHILHKKGFDVELLASYEPGLASFHEWWKQLFGESEGKEQKGIFPSSVVFSTDLHAIGQYIQEGRRIIFETLIHFKELECDLEIPYLSEDTDQLNYIAGRTFNEINHLSKEGTASAHHEGGVPIIQMELAKLDEYHVGYLIYFFMKACAMSAYLLEVDPFDQPGVDAYKQKMLDLLKAPVVTHGGK